MSSLSTLFACLVVAASLNPSSTSAAGPGAGAAAAAARATNGERAKMGLLPRRAQRSRVAYLDGAAGPGKAAMVSPSLDAQPGAVVVEDDELQVVAAVEVAPAVTAPRVSDVAASVDAGTARKAVAAAVDAPAAVASHAPRSGDPAEKVVQPAKDREPAKDAAPAVAAEDAAPSAPAKEAAPAVVANDAAPAAPAKEAAPAVAAKDAVPAAPANDAAPAVAVEEAAAAAPAKDAARVMAAKGALPSAPAKEAAPPAAAKDAAPVPAPAPVAAVAMRRPEASSTEKADPAAPRVAVLERVVDSAGEIVVRVVGRGEKVMGEKVVGSLDDLPVLSSTRAEDGNVVQLVEDDWGLIEVRRDAIGRFVSARPVERRTGTAD